VASPFDAARGGSFTSTANTSHSITISAPSAGDLLIIFCRFAAAPGAVTFTGYTIFGGPDATDASDDETRVYYRIADGTETSPIALSTTNSVKAAFISWRITGAAAEAPAISTVAIGTTAANTANPGSVAPAGAPQDTLYIAMAGGDGEVGAYTAFPASYANLVVTNSGTGGAATSNCFIGGASRAISASSSDDPGTFTHAAHSTGWTAFAVAIRPPQPATPSLVLPNRNRIVVRR
jgi:hypothetical protein